MTRAFSPFALAAFALSVAACGSSLDAAVPEEDPQFTADYVEDYESDVDEDRAQQDEQALLDQVDDIDDVEVLDDSSSTMGTTGFDTKGRTPPHHAPHGPVSIMEDEPSFSGPDATSANANVQEARQLGVRIVRVMIMWRETTKNKWCSVPGEPTCGSPEQSTQTPNFTKTDPNGYDWSKYDTIVENARAAGMQVLVTLAAPMPYWASEEPQHCLDQWKADQKLAPADRKFWSCSWKPDVRKYAQWVTAVARHFKGTRIWGWTVWNEPNIGGFLSSDNGYDDAMRYRKMWFAARKALRKTAGVRARVLFGDTANSHVADPNDGRFHLVRYALCLKANGEVFGGVQYKDCPDAPRSVQAAGVAFHPYSNSPSHLSASLGVTETIVDEAEGKHRLRAGRGLYLTEHGFLTDGADPALGGGLMVTPIQQRDFDDAVAEIVWRDVRIKSVAQYELYDDAPGRWDCGLKTHDGAKKPAYDSYKVAIDVRRIDASTVEIFSLARLASTTPIVVAAKHADGSWTDVDGIPTDETGFGAKRFDSAGVIAWRTHYLDATSREVVSP